MTHLQMGCVLLMQRVVMARVPRARSTSTGEEHTRLEDFWDEPTPSTRPTRSDAEALQGAWMSVAGRRPAELLVCGSRFAVHFADGDIYIGSFTLGTEGWPGTMDLTIEEGPSRHKGQLALCIYEMDGEVMRWCTASPGQPERPRVFAEHDPLHLCLVFRREHTNRRQ
jgi:uncharacterized protein (TIGR03067 family)